MGAGVAAARSAAASATRGVPLTDEHREKIREACQGKRRSAATCARIRTAKRGKKLGAAARVAFSAGQLRRWAEVPPEARVAAQARLLKHLPGKRSRLHVAVERVLCEMG